jgi:glycosyltransferase involved in cell wall biosynthesis
MSAPAGPVEVSVVVPVKNRRDLLRRTLAALDAQTFRDFEVLVVDDGSTDGADEEAAATAVAGRPVRLLRNEGAGAVAGRQTGVRSSTAAFLAFTDSDCEPDPDWLATAVEHLRGGAHLAYGRTMPARPVGPLERSVNEADGGLFPTCNLAVRRDTYDAVGGFDGAAGDRWGFRPSNRAQGLGFGEDTLFGWAVARTHPVAYDERMLVRHHVFPSDFREWLGRSWQVAAFPAIVREVPELRRTMVRHRVLFTHRSRVPLYATLGAVASRQPVLIGGALAWWVTHRFRHTLRRAPVPIPKRFTALPAQLVLDVVHAAALITGSVRARTLLL